MAVSWMRHIGATQRTLKKRDSTTTQTAEQMVEESEIPWTTAQPPEELIEIFAEYRKGAEERKLLSFCVIPMSLNAGDGPERHCADRLVGVCHARIAAIPKGMQEVVDATGHG